MAYLAIAQSEWSAGNFYQQVRNQKMTKSSFSLQLKTDNIGGVQLPTFIIKDSNTAPEKISRAQGAMIIENARQRFKEVLRLVVEIASLQTSFIKLDEVIKITSRRVNALEFIIIPNFFSILKYINQELDEMENEEKFTLKKVLNNRKKLQEEKDKAYKLKKERG